MSTSATSVTDPSSGSPSEPPSWFELPATIEEALSRTKALRLWISSRGAEYDATGADPADVMTVLAASGVQAINVPGRVPRPSTNDPCKPFR